MPSGTRILIRTIDAIDFDRNRVGDRFRATLEQPLIVDDVTVVPKARMVTAVSRKPPKLNGFRGVHN